MVKPSVSCAVGGKNAANASILTHHDQAPADRFVRVADADFRGIIPVRPSGAGHRLCQGLYAVARSEPGGGTSAVIPDPSRRHLVTPWIGTVHASFHIYGHGASKASPATAAAR